MLAGLPQREVQLCKRHRVILEAVLGRVRCTYGKFGYSPTGELEDKVPSLCRERAAAGLPEGVPSLCTRHLVAYMQKNPLWVLQIAIGKSTNLKWHRR